MPTLVLVHIGKSFPEYINHCISQVKHVTDIDIHLLISKEHTNKIKEKVNIFPLENIPISDKRKEFEKVNRLDSVFREGFWKYAMMRFFYIYDHVISENLTDIFHIENDNLIFFNFLTKLEVFQTKPMWCILDSLDRCVPGFLYFKNYEILQKLMDTCISQAAKGKTDMKAINIFRQENPNEVGVLPIIKNYMKPIKSIFFENAYIFECLFDAAAVGQFIGGIDPRNVDGDTIGYISEDSVIQCNKINIEWRNKCLFLNGLPLVNLHVHSKDLKRWMTV